MYKLYAEGEEVGDYETLLELRRALREIHIDYINDELQNQEKWPQDYPAGYDFNEAARQYIYDIYEVGQTLPLEALTW